MQADKAISDEYFSKDFNLYIEQEKENSNDNFQYKIGDMYYKGIGTYQNT